MTGGPGGQGASKGGDVDKKPKILQLNERLKHFKAWTTKLRVSLAFLNEKKEYYVSLFGQITDVTNIQNPNDIESLTGILDRTRELKRTKVYKERQVEQLKVSKKNLLEKLAKVQDIVG